MNVELKSVKIAKHLSEETVAFTASLHVDGKKVADVSNHGRGGPNDLHFSDPNMALEFKTWVESMPPREFEGITLAPAALEAGMDTDLFISLMLEDWEIIQWYKRRCRTQTLFRLKGENDDGSYRLIKRKFTPVIAKQIREKFGDNLAEIINERLA